MTPEEMVAAAAPESSVLVPSRVAIERLIGRLGEEADFEGAVELAVAEFKREEAIALMVAAVAAGRPCSAAILRRALWFLPSNLYIAVVLAAPGDRVGALAQAVASLRLSLDEVVQALMIAVHEAGDGPLPRALVRAMRIATRMPFEGGKSAALGAVIAQVRDKGVLEAGREHLERYRSFQGDGDNPLRLRAEQIPDDILDVLPKGMGGVVVTGITVRHAEKIGRNEPCPCGSGRKFKKCCLGQQERARAEPSPVPGLTLLEYKRQAHRHLDDEELARTLDVFDLARLPFEELDTDQLIAVYGKLAQQGCLVPAERALHVIEARSDRGMMGALEAELVNAARFEGDHRLLRRLLERRKTSDDAQIEAELALMDLEEGRVSALEAVFAACLRDLEGDDDKARARAGDVLTGILSTANHHRPALGVLLCRGAIASGVESDPVLMLGGLEDARDDLDLAPGDPIADYVDEILGNRVDHNTEHLLDAMREENQRLAEDARKSLEALRNARGQGRHVRRDLDRARRELRELEDDLEQATAPDPRVGELQDRVETLELAAQRLEVDKHALRAELSGMEQRLASRGGPGSAPDDDAFDQDALPPSFEHVLVPDWSPPARAAIAELDGNLAARALDIVTQVASGRAGEGARVKKLKGTEDLWSARLGIAHRILFRFDTPARALRVADVIARRELDKVLRRLG